MNNRGLTIFIAIIVVGLLTAVSLGFTVAEGENAVVYTFGGVRAGGVKTQSGAYWRLPIGIQRVEKVDMRLRALEIKGNEIVTTRDQHQIYLTLSLAWRVVDAEKYLRRLTASADGGSAENLLLTRGRGARQTVVSGFALTDLVSTSPQQPQHFAAVETALCQQLQNDMRQADCGIEVTQVLITRLALPKDTVAAISERMIKERETYSEKNIIAGKEEAKKIISRANLEKQNLISTATAEARKIRGEADAAAAEFYQDFKQNPQLAIFLRRLDALEEILKNKATITLPVNNPLDALIETPDLTKPPK